MEQEDFVSLEVAKFLEDKGYNEPCNSRYIVSEDGRYKLENYLLIDVREAMGLYKIKNGGLFDSYLAPSLYDAAKWLRYKHHIHVSIHNSFLGWGFSLVNIKKDKGKRLEYYDRYFAYYEDALNAGILAALMNI